jgi:hypothetical protein
MQAKTFYDNQGRIISTVYGDLSLVSLDQWSNLNSLDELGDKDNDWVFKNKILPREQNPATILGFTISNIPCAGTLKIDDVEYQISGSTVDLELPSGFYKVTLDCFPYLPKEFKVTA